MHLESSYLEAFAVRTVLGDIDLAGVATITQILANLTALVNKARAVVCMSNGTNCDIAATIKVRVDLMCALRVGMGLHARGSVSRNRGNHKRHFKGKAQASLNNIINM